MSSQKPKNPNVPGQALGYGLQYTVMTALLVDAPEGSSVSFEVFDDLAIETKSGERTLVQTKSALATNPLADRAVAFWKTLANWADTIAAGQVKPGKLLIYVSHECSGGFSSAFAKASTDGEAVAALAQTKEELWGPAPLFPLKAQVAETLAPQLDRFFAHEDSVQVSVVRSISVITGQGAPQQELRGLFLFVPKNKLEDAVLHACGWVQDKVNTLIGQRLPAVLSRDEFHAEMTGFIRKHAERAILHSVAPENLPQGKVTELLPRTFVQQLQIVGLDFETQMEAVSDFFRASIDRTYWGETAQVQENSFKQLDKTLKKTWSNLKIQTGAAHADKPEDSQGQILYSGCMGTKELVENLTPPEHFIPGCFHMLSETKLVGWHPKYQEKLDAGKKVEAKQP
jgi:hypothetical protein